jgi:hypothetical protein
MATHTALVSVYIDGGLKKRGATLTYAGPANWKFEPLDPVLRQQWEAETADPARVKDNLDRAGDYGYDHQPGDVLPVFDPRTGTTNLTLVPVENR